MPEMWKTCKSEEKFGYRDMGDGRHIPQSHCRECRIKELGKGH